MNVRTVSLLAVVFILAAMLAACGGGTQISGNTGGTALVSTHFSDPQTCAAPTGPYRHVYVAIKEVRIHQSAAAGGNDAGWISLTPGLVPVQVDVLANADANCFLATLGTNVQIPAGSYQQIRVLLVPDNERNTISGANQCASVQAANCIVLDDTGAVHPLELSSQDRTGIKIPSGQIAGGQFTVADGETVDFDVDLNACASIVLTGNGDYRLKPVLHAGEVTLQRSMSGKVVNHVDQSAVPGTVMVALEQRDSNNVARVVRQTVADPAGNFVICPVPALAAGATYDLVVTAYDPATGTQWAPTIVTGITAIGNLGNIPLFQQPGASTTPATIGGEVTTAGASGAVASDVQVVALQQVNVGGTNVWFTIPLVDSSGTEDLAGTSAQLATAASGCAAATLACATYEVLVPAAKPVLMAAGSATTPTQDASQPVAYRMEASAFVIGGVNQPNCSEPMLETDTLDGGGTLQVSSAEVVDAATLAFTGCQ